tara:strand:+ start:264 stop:509 length:246 start_codon:yes stop_codon:yes gene_type:complete
MTEKKSNRGRPKGATSFVRVALSDLIKQVGENATVVVSKKWLEGIMEALADVNPSKANDSIKEAPEPQEEIERIQFTIHND